MGINLNRDDAAREKGETMKVSITLKVVSVYTVIAIGSLILAGYLTNQGIHNYVITTTQTSLIREGSRIIDSYELYGNLISSQKDSRRIIPPPDLHIVEKNIPHEYVVVASDGKVLWNNFVPSDLHLLSKIQVVVTRALAGKIATGLYPQQNPIFVFVAIPFTYVQTVPINSLQSHIPPRLFMQNPPVVEHKATKVVALFARVSDLQRIASQIGLAVEQGLLASTLITILVGAFMMKRLMRPAGILKKAMSQVQKRNFSPVHTVHTGDEWEDISLVFTDMVQSLQSYDEAQKRFLQNASHELKTPLMAIRGYAEGLRDGVFSGSESARILDIVVQESVRMKKLVDELIYLSKLETLEEIYDLAPASFQNVIRLTIELLAPLAKQCQVKVLWQQEMTDLFLNIDMEKMEQALINIIGNAIRHAKSCVVIASSYEDFVYLTIEDDGEGFQDDDAACVFERFFHGAKGDTGLGLPIARAIIEKHHGTIIADNGTMGGARFQVRLPRLAGE